MFRFCISFKFRILFLFKCIYHGNSEMMSCFKSSFGSESGNCEHCSRSPVAAYLFPSESNLDWEEPLMFFCLFFLDPEIATSVLVHQRFVSLQQEQSWLSRAFDVAVRSFKLALAIFLWNNLVQPAFLSHTIHLATFANQKMASDGMGVRYEC